MTERPASSPDTAVPSSRVRVFRADTPHDIACATIVARMTEGDTVDVLCYATDKEPVAIPEMTWAMHQLAHAHPWGAVVDVSGSPAAGLTARWRGRVVDRAREPYAALRAQRHYRGLVSNAISRVAASLDEPPALFLNCFHHPDVRLFYGALGGAASASYFPHSFAALDASELPHYLRWVASPDEVGGPAPARDRLVRRIVGRDGVTPRRIPVDRWFTWKDDGPEGTIRLPPPDAVELDAITSNLSEETRARIDRLAVGRDGPAVVLLLNTAELSYPDLQQPMIDGYADLAVALTGEVGARTVYLKPHPRTSAAWLARSADAVRARLPLADVVPMTGLGGLPIELIAGRLPLDACGGDVSSSLWSMRRCRDIPSFVFEPILRLYHDRPLLNDPLREWVAANASDVQVLR